MSALRIGTTALCIVLMTSSPARPETAVERDLGRLAALLPGLYDNQEQVYFEPELDVPQPRRHRRLRQRVTPVDDPAAGQTRFEWRRFENDAATATTRGLWSLDADAGASVIRMRRWSLPLQADAARAAADPDAVGSRLCDVIWRRRALQFDGEIAGDCDGAGGGWLAAATEMQIPPAAIGDENAAAAPFVLRRARAFTCWVAVPTRDGGPWHFESGLQLHDQGGSAWVETDETEPQRVGIRMRNVAWPTGTNRDSLVLYVHRGDEEAAAAYAWGEPEARRLAINLRWMQASCTIGE